MSEMVERVARALFAADYPGMSWDEQSQGMWDVYSIQARAAIEAMREPTLAMLQAGREAARKAHGSGVSGMTLEAQTRSECRREDAAWRAMVGEMLK